VNQLGRHLQARPPSLHETRGQRHLFVWGDLGQWLVVDADAAFLLERFSRRQPVEQVVREYARARGVPFQSALGDALPVVETLVARGILGAPPRAAPRLEEPLTVANLTFNITNRCNLRCAWCYNRRSEGAEIPIAELMKWLSDGATALSEDATFIILGGEPFLDQRRLVECVLGARERFATEVLVSTNGTLWDEPTARQLAKAGVTVQVSIDSADAAKHDSVRGAGGFEQAVATAQRLVDARVRTILSMVMARQSEDEFEAYLELAATIGADEVRFIPLRRIGRGVAHAESTPDLFACFQRLVAILKRKPEWSRLLCRDFFSILMTVCRYSRLRDNCGIARRCLFVDADGSLFPCPNHRDPQYGCGHVRTTPLESLVSQSPVMQSLRAQYRLEKMPKCRECLVRYWCAGDCRAEALAVSGNPTAPSPYCDDLQKVMKEMFWLIADGWQGLAGHEREVRPWS
jgi:radical SAM protein with 4Fe4S-binding SPASM domain